MRPGFYRPILITAVAALCALAPSSAACHGVMIDPPSRALGTADEDYQFCFGTPGCECGQFPDPGVPVATYESGQTIQVTIDITQSHDAGAIFRFQLCPPDQLSASCFQSGEFETTAFDRQTGPRTYEITLPEDFVCDPCVLRWRWDYGFLSCADIRVVAHQVSGQRSAWTALKAIWR